MNISPTHTIKFQCIKIPTEILNVVRIEKYDSNNLIVDPLILEQIIKTFNLVFRKFKFTQSYNFQSDQIKLEVIEGDLYAKSFNEPYFEEFIGSINRCCKVAQLYSLPTLLKKEISKSINYQIITDFNKKIGIAKDLLKLLSLNIDVDPCIFIFKELGINIKKYQFIEEDTYCKIIPSIPKNLGKLIDNLKRLSIRMQLRSASNIIEPIEIVNARFDTSILYSSKLIDIYNQNKELYIYIEKNDIKQEYKYGKERPLQVILYEHILTPKIKERTKEFLEKISPQHAEFYKDFNLKYTATRKIQLFIPSISKENFSTLNNIINIFYSYISPYLNVNSYTYKITHNISKNETFDKQNYPKGTFRMYLYLTIFNSEFNKEYVNSKLFFLTHKQQAASIITISKKLKSFIKDILNYNSLSTADIKNHYSQTLNDIYSINVLINNLIKNDELYPYERESLSFCSNNYNHSHVIPSILEDSCVSILINQESDSLLNKAISVEEFPPNVSYIKKVRELLKSILTTDNLTAIIADKENKNIRTLFKRRFLLFKISETEIEIMYSRYHKSIKGDRYEIDLHAIIYQIGLKANTKCQKQILQKFPLPIRIRLIDKLSNIEKGIFLEDLLHAVPQVVEEIKVECLEKLNNFKTQIGDLTNEANKDFLDFLNAQTEKLNKLLIELNDLNSQCTSKSFLDYVIYIKSHLGKALENLVYIMDIVLYTERISNPNLNKKITKSFEEINSNRFKINKRASNMVTLMKLMNKEKAKLTQELKDISTKISSIQAVASEGEREKLNTFKSQLDKLKTMFTILDLELSSSIKLESGEESFNGLKDLQKTNIFVTDKFKEEKKLLKQQLQDLTQKDLEAQKEILKNQKESLEIKDKNLNTKERDVKKRVKNLASKEQALISESKQFDQQKKKLEEEKQEFEQQTQHLEKEKQKFNNKRQKHIKEKEKQKNERLACFCLFGNMCVIGLNQLWPQNKVIIWAISQSLACAGLRFSFPNFKESSKIEYITPIASLVMLGVNCINTISKS